MSFLRHLSLLLVPFLGGCGVFDSQPRPVDHSSGFFAEFDRMVDETMAQSNADGKAATFVSEFDWRVNEGPSDNEVHAVGSTWDKVRAFLDIGLLSAEVMASVNETAHPRVDIFADAADRVLRSDYLAITAWNQPVDTEYQLRPTADIVWESLHLVLTESGHAQRKVATTKGDWVEGYWTRMGESRHNLWVNGYNQTVWHDEVCHDEFVGTECTSVWVSETCTDVWIDDGYWESTCTQYDDDGNCTEWTDEWIDTGYYESQCIDAHYEDQCTDVYQTVCNPEYWEDIYIPAHNVDGVVVPGELSWVEGHLAEATADRIEVLPEQEAAILGLGIEYVLSFGPDYVQGSCRTELEAARQAFADQAPEDSIKLSRKSILYCLSRH